MNIIEIMVIIIFVLTVLTALPSWLRRRSRGPDYDVNYYLTPGVSYDKERHAHADRLMPPSYLGTHQGHTKDP